MMMRIIPWTLIAVIFLGSCKPEKENPPTKGDIHFAINYHFDGTKLYDDSLIYTNAAGQQMSVTRLQYYISNVKLYHPDNSSIESNDVFYCDFLAEGKNEIVLHDIPFGTYTGLTLDIGLDSVHNKTGALPNTADNENMAWPDAMGGGYHFMKLEGYYKDASGQHGYAMHLGLNPQLIHHGMISKSLDMKYTRYDVSLDMNMAEWFRNPNTYDFNKDGNYIMGNAAAMKKIADNGKDVFN